MNDKLLTDCKNKWKFTLCQFPFIHPSLSKPSMPFLNKVKFTFKRIYLSMRACNKLKSLPLHYIHRSEMRAFSSVPLVSVITAVIRSFESTSVYVLKVLQYFSMQTRLQYADQYFSMQTVLINHDCKTSCVLIRDGLFTNWNFAFLFVPQLHDLQLLVLEVFIYSYSSLWRTDAVVFAK